MSGFADGESSFNVSVYKNKNSKQGWRVQPRFEIQLHLKDENLILALQKFFSNVGSIRIDKKRKFVRFCVRSINELSRIIIPHFTNYKLSSQKLEDFRFLKQIVDLMLLKEHLTADGLQKIINIRASMNWGLSEVQKSEFANTKAVQRQVINTASIPDEHWLAWFASGEGNFSVNIKKSKTHKLGLGLELKFRLVQHARDKQLLELIGDYFKCGKVISRRENAFVYQVKNFANIKKNKIIPFFLKHPIQGVKHKDFQDLCKIARIMEKKKHLTVAGLSLIRKIKSSMNRGRKVD